MRTAKSQIFLRIRACWTEPPCFLTCYSTGFLLTFLILTVYVWNGMLKSLRGFSHPVSFLYLVVDSVKKEKKKRKSRVTIKLSNALGTSDGSDRPVHHCSMMRSFNISIKCLFNQVSKNKMAKDCRCADRIFHWSCWAYGSVCRDVHACLQKVFTFMNKGTPGLQIYTQILNWARCTMKDSEEKQPLLAKGDVEINYTGDKKNNEKWVKSFLSSNNILTVLRTANEQLIISYLRPILRWTLGYRQAR